MTSGATERAIFIFFRHASQFPQVLHATEFRESLQGFRPGVIAYIERLLKRLRRYGPGNPIHGKGAYAIPPPQGHSPALRIRGKLASGSRHRSLFRIPQTGIRRSVDVATSAEEDQRTMTATGEPLVVCGVRKRGKRIYLETLPIPFSIAR